MVVSTGHRNPWRITLFQNKVLESETGWYTNEEINHIVDGVNYGWPCFEGNERSPEYVDFDSFNIVCPNLVPKNPSGPVFSYHHPPAPNILTSISCVGGTPDAILFGDFTTKWLHRIDAQYKNEVVVATGVCPVEIKYNPNVGAMYVMLCISV